MSDAYDFWAHRLPRDQTEEIDAFWNRFSVIARDLDRALLGRADHIEPIPLMKKAFGSLSHKLFWEFGGTDPDGHTLAITAEVFHSRRVLARAVMQRAPRIPGWKVTDVRAPILGMAAAAETVRTRSRSEEIVINRLTPKRGAHRRVDLEALGEGDPAFVSDQSGVVFAVLLGDMADQNWLGDCKVTTANRLRQMGRRLVSKPPAPEEWFENFRQAAVDVISGLEAERPEMSFADRRMRSDKMVEFRLDPRAEDRAARNDALLYRTHYRALVAARIAGVPVNSLRFSRFFESFCGLKIMRGPGLPAEAESEAGIAEIAGDLEAALTSAGVGGVTGYGQGLEHIYIDLALEDVELSLGIIRTTLARGDVTAPTWMIFDEAGLEDRYFPITEGAPATPLVTI